MGFCNGIVTKDLARRQFRVFANFKYTKKQSKRIICLEIASKVANIARRTIGSAVRRSGATVAPKQLEKDVAEFSTKEAKPSKMSKIIAKIKAEKLGLDKKTVRELDKLPVKEFFNRSYDIICTAKGIQELRPKITLVPENSMGLAGMAYVPSTHDMILYPQMLKKAEKNRAFTFSLIRHEVEHVCQNFNILMTEGLGEEATKTYAERNTRLLLNHSINTFKNMPEEQISSLKAQGALSDNHYSIACKIKSAASQGDDKLAEYTQELFDKDLPIQHQAMKDFRDKVVEKLGSIKADSKEAQEAQKNFKSFCNVTYDANNLDLQSHHEKEAYAVQMVAYGEYGLRRFF